MNGINFAERGLLPDAAIRIGIRALLRRRIREISLPDREQSLQSQSDFVEELRHSPLALVPEIANEQHYEVPPGFFTRVLGHRLKYSSAIWPRESATLDEAEDHALALTCERAQIVDGMTVLDLGCGWGSLSLYIAEKFPECRVLSLSNSKPQREFILKQCQDRRLSNVEVVTADVNQLSFDRTFDRIVSVEMFEHLRNYELLFKRIANWLEPDGKLFVHIFCHREFAYPFTTEGDDDWMGQHFFTGGQMPSEDLLLNFQRDLVLDARWRVNGTHYQKTSEAWLVNMDRQRDAILPILADTYGADQARLWFQRWRIFFLSCAELFGFDAGNEWFVSHYRFERRPGETS